MLFRDWLRLFSKQSWTTCILIKGTFETGTIRLDLAARYSFGNYFTIEQLTGANPTKTSHRHFGIVPRLGWNRRRVRSFLRSLGPRKVIGVSAAVSSRLINDYRFPARKVITIPNGIDTERFQPDPVAGESWRRRLGIPRSALTFGAVGRLTPMKGYDTALVAFHALLKRFPQKDMRLLLIGEGPSEEALKKLAAEILPRERVIFWSFCDKPWEALNAVDVFVMPSLNEGLPLALSEAMACGCCPVASAAGGIPELLANPQMGWLVPVGDVDGFIAAMSDAVSRSPDERAIMGKHAREHITKHFNARAQLSALSQLIESVTASPRAILCRPGQMHERLFTR
jgi:glycosyltransferase involved in cell wall biosynthesis